MQTRKDDNAFPAFFSGDECEVMCYGLSKREFFAAIAMHGLFSRRPELNMKFIPQFAVDMADSLILELNKQNGDD